MALVDGIVGVYSDGVRSTWEWRSYGKAGTDGVEDAPGRLKWWCGRLSTRNAIRGSIRFLGNGPSIWVRAAT